MFQTDVDNTFFSEITAESPSDYPQINVLIVGFDLQGLAKLSYGVTCALLQEILGCLDKRPY